MNIYPRGDDRLSGPAHQIYIPRFIRLATFSGAGFGTAVVKVPCPDSRLRVKVAVLFIPPAGTVIAPSTFTNSQSIWIYETETDESGVNGGDIPTTNVEGTEASPTSFPEADGLLGYSREFVTAADSLKIQVAFATSPAVAGSWVAQFRYQPNNVSFTAEEWNAITAKCVPCLMAGPFTG